ncbi:peroxiredoxin [Phenylobacterium sp.]|jgi:peroxiredoxin|uniref:peroxiredoxin n=1 Tax=Phenylobacterium sp. TaxID=1871053 RepID=UPI002F3EF61F
MTIKVGDKLPSVTVTLATAEGPKPVATDEFFAGKKVALFALPGAFTPTCSAKHLPGFKQLASDIKAKGVDAIACLSVNDAFVMRAWAEDQAVGDDIVMIGDGGAAFTDAVGLAFDASRFGMGKRSQRYSMIVDDGVVKELNIEAPGEFKVSAADYMLAQL